MLVFILVVLFTLFAWLATMEARLPRYPVRLPDTSPLTPMSAGRAMLTVNIDVMTLPGMAMVLADIVLVIYGGCLGGSALDYASLFLTVFLFNISSANVVHLRSLRRLFIPKRTLAVAAHRCCAAVPLERSLVALQAVDTRTILLLSLEASLGSSRRVLALLLLLEAAKFARAFRAAPFATRETARTTLVALTDNARPLALAQATQTDPLPLSIQCTQTAEKEKEEEKEEEKEVVEVEVEVEMEEEEESVIEEEEQQEREWVQIDALLAEDQRKP